ncbi:glutathione S-transferase family protein [Rhodobacteraceae bacterium M382]|nr:glutathione S-transferase family protein [Rhodobacteraceae bacterium M382]
MTPTYRLHYAPDNASLVIRLALLELGQPFDTLVIDRRQRQQDSKGYRQLNPNGLIPVLETPDGPIFETAAILLWLADRHGALAPAPNSTGRASFLKWLFFASNTLHADLRQLFYAEKYIGPDADLQQALRTGMARRLDTHLRNLDNAAGTDWLGADSPSVLDLYLACQMRWMALYPAQHDRSWFNLDQYPALQAILMRLETRPSVHHAQEAEGLGPTPFTHPIHPTPPEGSAT